jgi:hypothetical protein
MNAPFPSPEAPRHLPPSLPATLEDFAPPPLLLPGESLQGYQQLRRAIFSELAPGSAIEWLLAIDVVELSWEIQRYRLLRHRLLENYRQRAIEHCLRQIDLPGIPLTSRELACDYIQQNAAHWRMNAKTKIEIEERLLAHGFDQHAISVEAYQQAREAFLTFEALITSAHNRRISLLREIDRQRCCRPYRRPATKIDELGRAKT